MKRTVLLIMVTVLSCFLVCSVSNVIAQDACEGNFDCDQDVDGTDAAVFKEDFGRSTFKNPCPSCQNNPCPNYYEPCASNDDCDSGCCCEELDADRCHDQTYCETVIGSQCINSDTSCLTMLDNTPCDGGDDNFCNSTCQAGTCSTTPLDCSAVNVMGDCQDPTCNISTGSCSPTGLVNDADIPFDGNECTEDICINGTPSNPFKTNGTPCSQGTCDGAGNCLKQNGEPCTADVDCASGFCPVQDGVCCDTMCSDTCEACLAFKTGGFDGSCSPVISNTDPDSECEDGECAEPWCDGLGSCAYTLAGTECGLNGEQCDGLGNCILP